jgi:hypothetical protein
VVAAYRAKLGPTVDRYFEEIPDPGDHPVFMLEDASATTASAVRG